MSTSHRSFLERRIPSSLLEQAVGLILLAPTNQTALCRRLADELQSVSLELLKQGDLTEAFAVLDALGTYEVASVSGEHLACAAKRLLATEVAPGGPYKSQSGQPELLPNLFIARCIRRHAQALPLVDAFLQTKLPLVPANSVEAILLQDCGFVATALQPESNDLLEITPWLKAAISEYKKPSDSTKTLTVATEDVLEAVQKALQPLAQTLKRACDELLTKLYTADRYKEISHLTIFFEQAVTGATSPSKVAINLGAANILCWLAYGVFDDLLDDDNGVNHLPIATLCLRRSVELYYAATPSATTTKLANHFFDTVDAANTWELENCRAQITRESIYLPPLPDFKRSMLAEKSLPHILGPLCLLKAGHNPTIKQFNSLQRGLEYYLMARQLNDDLHDWRSDLESGQLSFAATYLLKQSNIHPGEHQLPLVINTLQQYFWHQGLQELCTMVIAFSEQAVNLCRQSDLATHDSPLWRILALPGDSARQALTKHTNDKLFLQTFKHNVSL